MSEVVTWDDWPEESFDDPECQCMSLENHFFCPVHGGYDMGFALTMYKRKHPEKWPMQKVFNSLQQYSLRYRSSSEE